MKKHKDILWGIGLVLVATFAVILLAASSGSKPTDQTATLSDTIRDWERGSKGSPVTLVEYSDFQCPACAYYYPLVEKINEEFGDRITFVYRHFPLTQIHAHAEAAARAAEAAGKQDKFWEMYALLFENQETWSSAADAEEIFRGYALKLGLNGEQFKAALQSKETKEKIRSDYASGIASGVQGTPTFFLNGKKIENPRSYEEFKAIILNAINEKS